MIYILEYNSKNAFHKYKLNASYILYMILGSL